MASVHDLRTIALSMPGASQSRAGMAFAVRNGKKEKSFVWVWQERMDPKKPRRPNVDVWAFRVADLMEKDVMLETNSRKFFTEPHYDGFPAVLVRLKAVRPTELRRLVELAWRCQAPAAAQKAREGATRRPDRRAVRRPGRGADPRRR